MAACVSALTHTYSYAHLNARDCVCICVPCVRLMRAKTHKWKAAQRVIEVADILRLLKTKANRQHHVLELCLVHV